MKNDYDIHMDANEQSIHTIRQQENPLFKQLNKLRGEFSERVNEVVFVEAKHNKDREDDLRKLLDKGFHLNGKHYVRFGKSSSQAKDGVTVFVDDRYYDRLMECSQLGVDIDTCVVSKYEAYRNLMLSSCQTVDEPLPYIVIVDEYEKTIPDQHVRYAAKEDVEITDKKTKKKKTVSVRKIKEGKTDIEISPFDGFGVHTNEISKKFSEHSSARSDASLFQIRLPFMKGVSVEVDFKGFYKENSIIQIKDVFGVYHNIEDIDCIWNISMWKGFGIFKDNFGDDGWNEYVKRVKKYGFKIGISKFNHHAEEISPYSRLNFQYLQCLDLINPKYVEQFKKKHKYDIMNEENWGKIINVAKNSTDWAERIIKGDKLFTLKYLGLHNTDDNSSESKYIQAALINDRMLKDPSVKKMLKRKLDKTITQFKYGKIFAKGFYHTVVGDVIGYLEYCGGMGVKGCLNYGEFYANTLPEGEILSMRSPLVDPSEVNKVNLVSNKKTEKYLSHFKDKDICMINMYDLTMQQQGGMDEDGDTVFLTNEEILVQSKIDKPIVVDLQDKVSAKKVEYNKENIIEYECNSRDNRIGEITNIATSILNQYTENKKWQKINADNVSMLRLYQGKEIDFIKTGYRWIITRNLRKHLKKLPYFILHNYPKKLKVYNQRRNANKEADKNERVEYNAYRSPSAMNELCDYIEQWEKRNVVWDRSLVNNGDILVNQDLDLSNEKIMKDIRKINDEFNHDLRKTVQEDGSFDELESRYRDKLEHVLLDEELLANYCIKTVYRSMSADKTLCWMLYGDVMLKNLKDNTDDQQEQEIVETDKEDPEGHDFLGRYYKLVNKY